MGSYNFVCPQFSGILNPLDDDGLIGAFPWLVVRPTDVTKQKELEGKHSILAGESARFHQLIRAVGQARARASRDAEPGEDCEEQVRIAGQRVLHDWYLRTYKLRKRDFETDMALVAELIAGARLTTKNLLEKYIPLTLRPRLRMNAEVASAQDPIKLLRLCARPGSDSISRLARFEAARQGLITLMEFERYRLHDCTPKKLGDSMDWITDLFASQYFVRRKSDQFTVVAALDPGNCNRVKSFELLKNGAADTYEASAPTEFVLPVDARYIEWEGEFIPVLFDSRTKEDVSLKDIRKRERFHIPHDILGVKLTFFSLKDLLAGVARMRVTLVRAPGSVWSEHSNLFRAGVLDPTNVYSSSEYRAHKFCVILDGRVFEVQFVLIEDAINEIVAHGRENHLVYKATAYMDGLFPDFFPYELYRIDWSAEPVRRRLIEHQLAKF